VRQLQHRGAGERRQQGTRDRPAAVAAISQSVVSTQGTYRAADSAGEVVAPRFRRNRHRGIIGPAPG